MTRERRKSFALCLANDENEATLITGKIYRVLPDANAAKDDLIRVIDESGGDYLYHNSQFALVDFPRPVEKKDSCLASSLNGIELIDGTNVFHTGAVII